MRRALVLSGGGGRGAYELGVYKALQARGRPFDVLSGSSVGAITAAAIASGYSIPELESLWGRMGTFRVMQPRGDFWALARWTHLVYSRPLLRFLEKEIDYDAIRDSPVELRVSAVDLGTGDTRVFTNAEMTPKRLLASASMPLIFPMVEDEGRHYWDGGIVVNTPLQPAIEAGADDITCVLLSPMGARSLPAPRNFWEAVTRLSDLRHLGNLKEDLKRAEFINGLVAAGTADPAWRHIDFHVLSPSDGLGLMTILNFRPDMARRLIEWGYEDARLFVDEGQPHHAIERQAQRELEKGL